MRKRIGSASEPTFSMGLVPDPVHPDPRDRFLLQAPGRPSHGEGVWGAELPRNQEEGLESGSPQGKERAEPLRIKRGVWGGRQPPREGGEGTRIL